MARALRTLSINFPFKSASVICEADFSTPRALFDFDVAVVRPYCLLDRSGGRFSVEWNSYSHANGVMQKRVDEAARLLDQGGLLVVVLSAVEVLKCRTGGYSMGTIYTTTNYDFLDPRFYEVVHNGTGDRVDCFSSDPFTKVIKASTVSWTAFIDHKIPYPFLDPLIFARNGRDAIVGASVPVRSGHIIFLPNFKQLDEAAFLEACLDYRSRREGTPAPAWVQSVYLPDKHGLQQAIASLELKVEQLQEEVREKRMALGALLGFKKLLYEKGKTQLEPIVLKALDEFGFQTSPGELIAGTSFEIDGRTKVGSSPGLLEIKGSKNQIALDEFSPFTTKILSDFQATNVHSKGILVGNGLCLERPDKRLGSRVFSSHVLEAAKRNSVALVNSVELYAVFSNLLEERIHDIEAVRETILAANGYADLSGFIVKSPFSGTHP
jgi:hypothetical protein